MAPFLHPEAPWGHLGTPWERQEGHMAELHRIFMNIGTLLGFHREAIGVPRLRIPFFVGFLSKSFLVSLPDSTSGALGLQKVGARKETIANGNFFT